MKRFFACVGLFFIVLTLSAQAKKLTVLFPVDADTDGCKMYVQTLEPGVKTNTIEMAKTGRAYSADVTLSSLGLYSVVCVVNQNQIIMPVYADGAGTMTLDADWDGRHLSFNDNANNSALTAYVKVIGETNRYMWTAMPKQAEAAKTMMTSYMQKADSILGVHKCNADVEKYIRLWAYTNIYRAYISLPRMLGCRPKDMPVKASEVMARPETILDTPMSMLFTITPTLISNFMPRETTITEQMDWLYGNFKCREIVDGVAASAIGKHISRFNYAENYDEGLAELKSLTQKYSLPDKYVKTFIGNKATVKGNPFPTDVVFKDAKGNVVSIDQFKGKYIYIDMWASWCVPCRKEIPHLQRLEKELQNTNVVFLSISVDAKPEPWKKAMTDLNLHGHQWHDSNASLTKALNVRGIPFFIIYDKEGKLYMYDAPRPSHPQLKNLLEELK